MEKHLRSVLLAALVVIVIFSAFVGGFMVARLNERKPVLPTVADSSGEIGEKVDAVEEILREQALKPPNEASATAGAIGGLLESTGDKYAVYLDKRHFKYFAEQSAGEFGGIGVVIGEKDDKAYVVSVMADTPAAKAGMKKDDVFVGIDGERRDGWSSDEVVKRVRGEEGTKVTVTMKRGSGERTFTLTRAKIEVPNIKSRMLDGGVGYIRLYSFNQRSRDDVQEAIESLADMGARGFILDVRDNPGGLLDQAVDLASAFIESGVIVRVDERGKPEEIRRATGNTVTDAPVVLLVNGDSASASEILAGALQDHARATIVGETTFGKGSVQTVEELDEGAAIKFTIAHYLTPKKRVIDGKGVTPDHVVKMERDLEFDPEMQSDLKKDTQLQKAIEVLREEL